MSNQALTVQATEISSSQEWTTDPDMIEIYVTPEFLEKAEKCVAFMQENDISKMTDWHGFGYDLFQSVGNVDEDDLDGKPVVKGENDEYVTFEPEYRLDGCHAQINKYGDISAAFPFKYTSGELCCSVGSLSDLKSKMGLIEEPQLPALRYWAVTGRIPGEHEDTLYVFHVATRQEALDAFDQAIWENEKDADSGRENVFKEHGQTVFVNSIVVSDSPILEA